METKPNILLIMADQLTPFLMGAYGAQGADTPNLDRLVEEGIRFDAAYSPHPVCAPARFCLMAGRYASRIGAWDNAALFPADVPTCAHYLSAAGYDTVLTGKMHFVGPDQLHGFRKRCMTNIYPADFRWTNWAGEQGEKSNQASQYVEEAIRPDQWSSPLAYDEETHFHAMEYLRRFGYRRESEDSDEGVRQDGGNPFFLCVSYHHPHEPFLPPASLWEKYSDRHLEIDDLPADVESTYSELDRWIREYNNCEAYTENLSDKKSNLTVRRAYCALIEYIDNKVGELLAELEHRDLLNDTMVMFTSDHGDMLCEKAMVQKRVFYEWSARVPLIIRMPRMKHAGVTNSDPVNLIDLMPTMLDAAGVPEDERCKCDGRSLLPLIEGRDGAFRESISENPADDMVKSPCFMIRRGKYKYTYIHGYRGQFFDIEKDPGEWSNLVDEPEYRPVKEALESRILELFDPDNIKLQVDESIKCRLLIDRSMKKNNTSWNAKSGVWELDSGNL